MAARSTLGVGRVPAVALVAMILCAPAAHAGGPAAPQNAYEKTILAAGPVGYWSFDDDRQSRVARQLAGDVPGYYHDDPAVIRGVVGKARRFDGRASFVSIANRDAWSQTATGNLTVEFWMRPDRLVFEKEEGSGYVWILGKGEPDQHEWAFRMYGQDNRESPPRENRIAFYAYNLAGGEGAGAYFQKPVVVKKWIYVVGELTSQGVTIFRDGVFSQGPPSSGTLYANPRYNITPAHGTALLRVGTRNRASFFSGGVDELAIYPYLLSARTIHAHYVAGLSAQRENARTR